MAGGGGWAWGAGLGVSPVFSDNMVVQREMRWPVWGTAAPGAEVTVRMAGVSASEKADAAGKWRVYLPELKAGGPHELSVEAGGERRTFTNVLAGEVWICSGQSNMEWPLSGASNGPAEVASSAHEGLRLLSVPRLASRTPVDTFAGSWAVCGPETAAGFSAVAYYFGREVHKALGAPVGLVKSAWGGTRAEAWTPAAVVEEFESPAAFDASVEEAKRDMDGAKARYRDAVSAWNDEVLHRDEGIDPAAARWGTEPAGAAWEETKAPGAWEKAGLEIDGAVWLRRAVVLKPDQCRGPAALELGMIDDWDVAWVNGREVGRTGREVDPLPSEHARTYTVPAGVLKPGTNVIAVRVFDRGGLGGFLGPAAEMRLAPASGAAVPLAGTWTRRVERRLEPIPAGVWARRPRPPGLLGEHARPSALYNGMIAPLVPMAFRGVIWYQGESNASRARQYRALFPAMIRAWRAEWQRGDFPFYYVQLASFMARKEEPAESAWAELREAQLKALDVANTGMAVAIDIGEAEDIHPKNKREVGRRLALWALARAYRPAPAWWEAAMERIMGPRPDNPECSGPLFEGWAVEGVEARVRFRHAANGLATSDGKPPRGFALAGEDRRFVWAHARIEGREIVVSSPEVGNPVSVRYGWAANPDVNLVNGMGLPASPFRTDDWVAAR